MTTRRQVIGGAVASVALAPWMRATAAVPDRLFAATPLAGNRVAASFSAVDLPLPDVVVLSARGRERLPRLAGRARLLTLWAEWCVPCLLEARDMAAAQPRIGGGAFDIVSVLTGSGAKLDHPSAVERLRRAGVEGLTLLVEPGGGHTIGDALGTRPPTAASPEPGDLPPGAHVVGGGGIALPCTLLVDRRGRVRGRSTGMMSNRVVVAGAAPDVPHRLTDAEKQAMMSNGSRTA